MILDYSSVLLFFTLNNIFIIGLFVYSYFYHHKQWYLLLFALGVTFQCITFILYGFKDYFSITNNIKINNFLMMCSFALTSFGLISFDGKFRKNVLWIFISILSVLYGSILIFQNHLPSVHTIRIVSSAIFYGTTSYYLLFNKNKYKFATLIGSTLFIYAIFQLVRAYRIYTINEYDFFNVSTFNNWFLILTVFVISVYSIGYIMLLKEIDQKTILDKNLIIERDKLKLAGLNHTQNKLLSIIGHDLRSPFNNIIGLSDLLFNNAKNNNDLESQTYIDLISSTSRNTLILVDNLLNWARSQTEEFILHPEKFILSCLITEIIELKSSLLKAKNITLTYNPTEEIELYTDKNVLATILRNLISNAIKYTDTGGSIHVATKLHQQKIKISISDNGIGMDKATIHKILELSDVKSCPGTENEKGFGIGLILCKDFIKKLNGTFWIESSKGKGSSFKFTLPTEINT